MAKVCTTLLQHKQNSATSSAKQITCTATDYTYNQYDINRIEVSERIHSVMDLYYQNGASNSSTDDKYYATVKVNGVQVKMEVDSDSCYYLIPKSNFNTLQLNVPLQPTTIAFHSYSGEVIPLQG